MDNRFLSNRPLLIAWLLIAAVAVVFWEAPLGDFLLQHDDREYVTDNPGVTAGLSMQSVQWAFTRGHAANWHPLTWISHQLDVQLYGLEPFGHHMTSLVLHGLNTLLLLLVLHRATGHLGRSGFVAALFAVHPLHVESVAWIAERKDMLSTFFMLCTIRAYLGYVKKPGVMRYLGVALLYSLGLLSKPMVVTLPFVLLLLDYWPLERKDPGKRVLEKVPLLGLAAASCVVTVIVQKGAGAMQPFPLGIRVANALVSYVKYILMTIWPKELAAQYPHPESGLPLWQAGAAAVLLAAITLLVFRYGRRKPYLPVGWLWYLGTLVPVVGFVQVGNQAMADRYTYIPLIGLFVIAAWGACDLFFRPKPAPKAKKKIQEPAPAPPVGALEAGACVVLLILMAVSHRQVGYWKDSITLFRHALEVTENNYLAEHDLGMALIYGGKPKEALAHLEKAVKLKPDWGPAYIDLAMVHYCMGHRDEALRCVALGRKHGCEPAEDFLRDLMKKN